MASSSTTSHRCANNRRQRRSLLNLDIISWEEQQEQALEKEDEDCIEDEPTTASTTSSSAKNGNNNNNNNMSDQQQQQQALDEQTDHFLHMYSQLSSNVFQDSSNYGKPIILSSLSKLDDLLEANTTTVSRTPGMNVDTVSTTDGKYFLRCHLATLMDFSHYDDIPYKHAFEAAASIALAAHHLNEGIGWIVPELAGLHQRCPIRFTTEFADTEYDQGVSLKNVIDMTDRINHRPCAFIGATQSTVSIPTAIVTGIRGYPQVSSQSTSEQLDDQSQFPLFGRTVPSDVDNAVPIVKFFRNKLNATHLSVLHVNNGYGNAFADDLKFAAQEHTPDLHIEEHELSEHPNSQLIADVITQIKSSEFSYIFAALNDDVIDAVMEEAYHQKVAGDGIHSWFFSNTFADIDDRYFEKDSPLHKAYRGAGRMQVSGGHQGMASFDTFACNLRTLRSSPPDLDYFASLLPQKEFQNVYNFPGQARDFTRMPYIYDDDFLNPVPKMADRTSPAYEAAIALGLAACDVVNSGLPLTGENHFEAFKHVSFKGVEAEVRFLNETGTRDPNTTLFAVENEVENEVEITQPDGSLKKMIKFHTEVSDIYDHGEWTHLEDYIFNDGTTAIPADLIPPQDVVHHYIHTPLKVVGGLMYLAIMGLAIRYIYWTETNKKQRVVRASQPLFLRVILAGVIIFASAIVPLNIDDRVTDHHGCSIACNMYYWLFFMGFAIMFSGLFTKIYRVNQIMNNPVKFRRVKVSVKDVIKPMAAIIGVNFILLTAMTAAAPSEWEIVVSDYDQHGRPTETYGHCSSKDALPFYITLGIVNFSALCFSIKQAYDTRKLATEFSESRYIFYAMIGIVVALFQGIPVLVLVRDSPDTQDFIKCSVIFVTCMSVLLFMFVPKQKFLIKQMKKTKGQRFDESIKISGLNEMDMSKSHTAHALTTLRGSGSKAQLVSPTNPTKAALSSLSGLSGQSSGVSSGGSTSGTSEEGVRFTTKSAAELNKENAELRRKLNLRNVSIGTLKTDSSVSGGSDGSSGIQILARKSPTELMQENRKLKKLLREAKKMTKPTLIQEENEDDSEVMKSNRCQTVKSSNKKQRQVSFSFQEELSKELSRDLSNELNSSLPQLRPLVMPTESEGGVSVDNSITDITATGLSVGDIEAANTVPTPPGDDDEEEDQNSQGSTLDSDDDTAPNSSDNTAPMMGDVMGRFTTSTSEEFRTSITISEEFGAGAARDGEEIDPFDDIVAEADNNRSPHIGDIEETAAHVETEAVPVEAFNNEPGSHEMFSVQTSTTQASTTINSDAAAHSSDDSSNQHQVV